MLGAKVTSFMKRINFQASTSRAAAGFTGLASVGFVILAWAAKDVTATLDFFVESQILVGSMRSTLATGNGGYLPVRLLCSRQNVGWREGGCVAFLMVGFQHRDHVLVLGFDVSRSLYGQRGGDDAGYSQGIRDLRVNRSFPHYGDDMLSRDAIYISTPSSWFRTCIGWSAQFPISRGERETHTSCL